MGSRQAIAGGQDRDALRRRPSAARALSRAPRGSRGGLASLGPSRSHGRSRDARRVPTRVRAVVTAVENVEIVELESFEQLVSLQGFTEQIFEAGPRAPGWF